MGTPYSRAPHQGGTATTASEAPHAALLIDFDNVTMGMRSDLSKELKSLLGSDVIKGKVSVQRAYADWRRYPQYIVPLSEASVDLIFAPAYGSNKKNATDIRMAIDALELVFIRPEIGTYILLTGDSDFSSLVLKLKEYGKYVIGVGIQESSSDILVQNCDEYYSYTSLTGLEKTTESDHKPQDAWVLVTDALKRMKSRNDVMRSDRLKQVMQEIDGNFDEGSLGFSKFSRFLAEASSRGLVKLRKMDNGQYDVSLPSSSRGGGRSRRDDGGGGRRGQRDRGGRQRDRGGRQQSSSRDGGRRDRSSSGDPLQDAYDMMTRALEALRDDGREPVRDSDVKRKMLEYDRSFDEAELGFPKFSKFLGQAADHDVVRLSRTDTGNFEVSLPGSEAARTAQAADAGDDREEEPREHEAPRRKAEIRDEAPTEDLEEAAPSDGPTEVEVTPDDLGEPGLRLWPRRGSTRRRGGDEPPPLFEGQMVASPDEVRDVVTPEPEADDADAQVEEPAGAATRGSTADLPGYLVSDADFDDEDDYDYGSDDDHDPSADYGADDLNPSELGLPTEEDSILRYLAHRYRGVGEKTAEALVDRFGTDVFRVLRDDPDAIHDAVTPKRAEQVLEAWDADYTRRTS